MRIFLSMNLVAHTGHGVPTIVNKYGEEAFEIEDNYIKCTIPFDREVMEYRIKSGGINAVLMAVLNHQIRRS